MRFFKRIDKAEFNVFNTYQTAVLGKFDNLVVRTALVMEYQLPWKLASLVSTIGAATKSNESIKLYTNWNIPFECAALIAEPHGIELINQIRGNVLIEGGLDLLENECEIVETRHHHIQTPNFFVGTDLPVV